MQLKAFTKTDNFAFTVYASPTVRQMNPFQLNGEGNNFDELENLFRQTIAKFIKNEIELSKKDIPLDDIYIVSHKFVESTGVHHFFYKVNTHLKKLSDTYFTIKTQIGHIKEDCVGCNSIVSFTLGFKCIALKKYGDNEFNYECKLLYYVGEYKDPVKFGRKYLGLYTVFYNKPSDVFLHAPSSFAITDNLLYESSSYTIPSKYLPQTV